MFGSSALVWSPEMLLEGPPVRIDDGDDITQGATTDAALFSDSSGTVIGFLRGMLNQSLEQRRLLEQILIELQFLRQEANEERSKLGRQVEDGWTGLR